VALPPRGVLQVRSADGDHAIALYRPLVLAHFSRPPTDTELDALRAIVEEGRTQAGQFGASAVVVLMRGFAGALMRSFL
jgi:hypothetical protein